MSVPAHRVMKYRPSMMDFTVVPTPLKNIVEGWAGDGFQLALAV
jgi:hypothetical protein